MAMKAIIDAEAHAALAENLRSEYVEKDGKFVLDVTPVDGLELSDVGGLRSALTKERENVRKAQALIEKFGEITPDQAREALAELEKFRGSDPDKKAEELAEVKVKQVSDKLTAEKAKVEKELADTVKQLEAVLITDAATRAILDAEGEPTLLLPHVERATRLRRLDDGKRIVEVLDDDGNVRLSTKSGSTDAMSLGEFVSSLKENDKFAPAFKGSGASGSGAGGDRKPGSAASGNGRLMDLPPAERIKAFRQQEAAK